MNLPAFLSAWRLHRQDGGPGFGVTVTAETGHGDMTFTFEVNTLDPSCEQAARDAGFPPSIIDAAISLLSSADHKENPWPTSK